MTAIRRHGSGATALAHAGQVLPFEEDAAPTMRAALGRSPTIERPSSSCRPRLPTSPASHRVQRKLTCPRLDDACSAEGEEMGLEVEDFENRSHPCAAGSFSASCCPLFTNEPSWAAGPGVGPLTTEIRTGHPWTRPSLAAGRRARGRKAHPTIPRPRVAPPSSRARSSMMR